MTSCSLPSLTSSETEYSVVPGIISCSSQSALSSGVTCAEVWISSYRKGEWRQGDLCLPCLEERMCKTK